MKSIFLIAATVFVTFHTSAQSLRAYERAGDKAFKSKNYAAALSFYACVLQRHDSDQALLWKYAESARLYRSFPEAERSYLKLAESPAALEKWPLLDLRIGEIKQQSGDYEGALVCYSRFLENKPEKAAPEYLTQANEALEGCRMALGMLVAPAPVEIKHLGKEVNTPWNEFAPTVVGDTLFYTSNRFDQPRKYGKNKAKIHKVMLSVRSGRGREPGRGFPSADSVHIAHTAFSPDGHYVFFTICKDNKDGEKRCELWLTAIDRRNRWLPPLRLPEPINLPGYTTTQPTIGFDKATEGPMLWFASDRPGGKGKLDLWSVPLDSNFFCPCNLPLPGKKFSYLPEFQQPQNLSALNTPGNDVTPFFNSPNQKLYFSSDGLPGMGGYDIFSAEKTGNEYSMPQNAGPGLNSSANDLYLFLKRDGKNGYFSSNRKGAIFLDKKNEVTCHDIYAFHFPEVAQPTPPLPDTGASLTAKHPGLPPRVPELPTLTIPKLSDFNGLPLYFDNDEPDKRTRKTVTQKTYDETVEAYLDRQSEYRERFSAKAEGAKLDAAESQVDDFFEEEVRKGFDRLTLLSDQLLQHLQSGDSLEILVKGYTSPRAESDYNLNLGKRRVSSVRNYFEHWSDGVLQPYLRSGKLRITETSFGETTVRAGVSDRLNDELNSIYHPDAARERRVEIVEVKRMDE